jgi:hypothetical protein
MYLLSSGGRDGHSTRHFSNPWLVKSEACLFWKQIQMRHLPFGCSIYTYVCETASLIFGHFFPGDRDALWRLADFETIFPLS